MAVLSVSACVIAGCAGSSQVASNTTNAQASAGAASSQSYRAGGGVPTGGYTTDIGTAIRNAGVDDDPPPPVIGPPAPGQQTAAQQQPRPKAEPHYNVGYGVSSAGPSTDVFTALFGSN